MLRLYVMAYVVVLGYMLLAAISPQATVVPDTLAEWERVGLIVAVAHVAMLWGMVLGEVRVHTRVRRRTAERVRALKLGPPLDR